MVPGVAAGPPRSPPRAPCPYRRRIARLRIVIPLAVAAAAAATPALIALAQPAADLPDLVSDPAERPGTSVHSDGRLLLRFDGYVSNRDGAGPLEIRASSPDGVAPAEHRMRVVEQWAGTTAPGAGGRRVTSRPGGQPEVRFEVADGHLHYHLKNAAEYSLWTEDRGAQVAIAQKTEAGFCLEDSARRGSGAPGRYSADLNDFCRDVPLVMGISAGWRDRYHRDLSYQWVDVSSVPPGLYQLGTRVDPGNVIVEQNEDNPAAFVGVVVPGYRAVPITLPVVEPGTAVPVRLRAERFAGRGDAYSPGALRYRIDAVPAQGRLEQGGRLLRAGDELSSPDVTLVTAGTAPDGFRYSAIDTGRRAYPRDAATGAPAHPSAAVTTSARPAVAISGAPASLTAGLGVQLTASVTGVPGGVTWTASAGRVDASGLYVAPASVPPGETVTVRAASTARPDVAAEVRIRIVAARRGQAAALGASCAVVPARPASGRPGTIRLSRAQMLVSQRIAQAALRRADAVDRWLAAGVTGNDLCGGSIRATQLGPGLVAGPAATPRTGRPAAPRPLVVRRAGGGDPGAVRLDARQLLINQRISQAAIRRVAALEARLDAGLTGGDVRPGAVSLGQLAGDLRVVRATPAARPAPSVTRLAPARRSGGRVTVSVEQLRINQRIAQAAVRRSNALQDRIRRGLTGDDLRPNTLVADNLAPDARP